MAWEKIIEPAKSSAGLAGQEWGRATRQPAPAPDVQPLAAPVLSEAAPCPHCRAGLARRYTERIAWHPGIPIGRTALCLNDAHTLEVALSLDKTLGGSAWRSYDANAVEPGAVASKIIDKMGWGKEF